MKFFKLFPIFLVLAVACAPPSYSGTPPVADSLGVVSDSEVAEIERWAASTKPSAFAALPVLPDTAGYKPLMSDNFAVNHGTGNGPIFWNGQWAGRIGTYIDPTAGPMLRYTYPVGQKAGVSPGFIWSTEPVTPRAKAVDVYESGYFRYSLNFQNPTANVSKTYLHGYGKNGNQLIVGLTGKGLGPHFWKIEFQTMGSRPTSASVGRFKVNPADACPGNCNFAVTGAVPMRRGMFDHVELQTHSGMPGTRTSSAKLWVNGVLVVDVSGFDYVKAGVGPELDAKKGAPVWGGGGASSAWFMTLDWMNFRMLWK